MNSIERGIVTGERVDFGKSLLSYALNLLNFLSQNRNCLEQIANDPDFQKAKTDVDAATEKVAKAKQGVLDAQKAEAEAAKQRSKQNHSSHGGGGGAGGGADAGGR